MTNRAHFLHINKNGGKSIKAALAGHLGSGSFEIVLHPHQTRMADVPEGEKFFFVVRDPIDRFVSGFYGRFKDGVPTWGSPDPWRLDQQAYRDFSTPNELAEAIESTDEVRAGKALRAMMNMAHVRNSYWEWFGHESHLRGRWDDILFIGFLDSLDEDFPLLRARLGLPDDVVLPRVNTRTDKNPGVTLDKHLSDLALENLRRWFRRDYYLMDLCREFREGSA